MKKILVTRKLLDSNEEKLKKLYDVKLIFEIDFTNSGFCNLTKIKINKISENEI